MKVRFNKFIDRITRRFRLADHFLAVFIPDDLRGNSDAVRALAPAIMGRIKAPPRHILLDQAVEDVQKASYQAGLSGIPFRVVLFAHPNDNENGFAINPGARIKLASLYPAWWEATDHHYEFVYAHVCNGASVLNRDPWTAIFPRWVSYQMVVEVFLATPIAEQRWVELGTNLVMGAWQSENVEGLFHRLQGTYSEALARLYDTYDDKGGDAITMAFLEKSLAALTRKA